jgi:hypothetical protein
MRGYYKKNYAETLRCKPWRNLPTGRQAPQRQNDFAAADCIV